MNWKAILALLTALAVEAFDGASASETSEATAYVNGLWFDGSKFVARDMTVRDGIFVRTAPRVARKVDLHGAYVVPAFGEAHHHTVLCDTERTKTFIDAGIVYAAIMNATVSSRGCEESVNEAAGLEIVNALAGVTARNAHPSQIGLFFLRPDQIEGNWVHYVDSRDELERIWPKIAATKPDFVKLFLSYSEDFAMLRDDKSMAPWYRGMDPALVRPLVQKAHAAHLRVAAHVNSAHDFDVAIDAGVDIIAHMPGAFPGPVFTEIDAHPYLLAAAKNPSKFEISKATARKAKRQDAVVITTVSGVGPTTPPWAAIRKNFKTLREARVPLLIGSDLGEYNSVDEATYVAQQGLMVPIYALRSLSITTPRALFPGRRIGAFKPGFEATFVALGADPTSNIDGLRDVRFVVKKGEALRPPQP